MTTKVTIEANHGWPVDVTPMTYGREPSGLPRRVPANATEVFYVHSGQDLLIHEVQSDESQRAN